MHLDLDVGLGIANKKNAIKYKNKLQRDCVRPEHIVRASYWPLSQSEPRLAAAYKVKPALTTLLRTPLPRP